MSNQTLIKRIGNPIVFYMIGHSLLTHFKFSFAVQIKRLVSI